MQVYKSACWLEKFKKFSPTSMSTAQERQNIVIVGGGFVGISTFNALASHLDATASNLVLITPRPYFTHLPAALRLVVTSEGKLEDTALLPFGAKHNGPNKKVLNAKVTSIVDSDTKGRYVVLENGNKIDFSVLVLTPGSIWEGPLNFPDNKEEHLDWINTWRTKFGEADDIVLVGGGAVGLGKYCVSCL
jgi:NAD(P)H-nitrite reductase large subunit